MGVIPVSYNNGLGVTSVFQPASGQTTLSPFSTMMGQPAMGSGIPNYSQIGNYGVGTPAVPSAAMPSPASTTSLVPNSPVDNLTKTAEPMGWLKSTIFNKDGGLNLDAIGSIAGTIGDFGKLYMGYKANKLAEDSLNFQKQAYQTNLANQTSSYNLALEDRVNGRYSSRERNEAQINDYLNKHRLGG